MFASGSVAGSDAASDVVPEVTPDGGSVAVPEVVPEAASEAVQAAQTGNEEPLPILGYALVLFRKNSCRARLYSLAVAGEAQGRGVGRALIRAAEEHVRARGCGRIGLEVRTDNHRAQVLYESQGFVRRGIRSDFYEDGCDAVLMEKPLEP